MALLIDTYNVLHLAAASPDALSGLDVAGLAELVAAHGMGSSREATLVCDGTKGPTDGESSRQIAPGVMVRYAGSGADADTLLERLIEEDSAPRRLLVVSSDRRVQRAAQRRRARVESSEVFLRRLIERARRAGKASTGANPLRAQVPLDVYSTAGWMRVFGYDASDIVARAGSASALRRPEPAAPQRTPDRAASTPQRPPERADQRRDRQGAVSPPATSRAEPAVPPHAAPPDPLLAEAIRAWEGRLSLDDLDMERWLGSIIERPRE